MDLPLMEPLISENPRFPIFPTGKTVDDSSKRGQLERLIRSQWLRLMAISISRRAIISRELSFQLISEGSNLRERRSAVRSAVPLVGELKARWERGGPPSDAGCACRHLTSGI